MTTPTNQQPPLPSLARLAELDAAASEGPWSAEVLFWLLRHTRKNSRADAEFIAAAKGFAPALKARMEALAVEWEVTTCRDPGSDKGWCLECEKDAERAGCAVELRALIRGEGEA